MWKFLIVLVLLAGGGYAAWRYLPTKAADMPEQKKDEAPQPVAAKKGDLKVIVQASGRVVPNQEVEIKCKASGEVIKLSADVSESVKKGQLLVELDPVNEERTVKQAAVKLTVSQAKLEQAKLQLQIDERELVTERMRAAAAVKSAEARLDETNRKLERDRAMVEAGAASHEEHEKSVSAQIQALAALDLTKARFEELKTQEVALQDGKQAITIAEQDVESNKIALSDANQRLRDTRVMAPIDAVVADRKVQEGQIIASGVSNVGGGTTVMTLADLSRIFVLASVDQSDIGRIDTMVQQTATEQTNTGDKGEEPAPNAQIVVDAYPDMFFPARVVRVAPKGVNSSNVVTYEVKVEVPGPRRRLLKPEMLASVSITAVDKTGILLVPVGAVERRRRDRFVTVVKADGTNEDRQVETGATDGEQMEISSGLSEGETVKVTTSGGQSKWKGGGSDKARQDRMQMRVMGGALKK